MKTAEVAKFISEVSKKELGLLYYSAEELERIIAGDQAVVLEENNQLAAFGAWTFRNEGWVEAHTLYIAPEFRGKGYLRKIFAGIYEKLRNQTAKAFLFTQAPAVIRVANDYGFKRSSFFSLPRGVLLKIILRRIDPRAWVYYFKYASAIFRLFKFRLFVRG